MKIKHILILFIILLNFNLFSQNWNPINKNDKFNFKIDTFNYITNVIFTDSVKIINEDSIFYLNRIMTNCDTCSNNEYHDFALRNQPQFLMRKVIKESDSIFIFQDTSEFIMMPLKKFGESWVYNQEDNINAVISFVGEDVILGITDSVKTVSLSNGQQIKISKNFGIIEFPINNSNNYILIGIEGSRESGERLPNFGDFFDYEIGDIFQRIITNSDNEGEYHLIKKYKILSKEVIGDTLKYEINGRTMHLDYYNGEGNPYHVVSVGYFDDEIRYIDSTKHFTNTYPNELIDIVSHTIINIPFDLPLFNKVMYYKDNDEYIIRFGEDDFLSTSYIEDTQDADLLINFQEILFEYKYSKNLGLSSKIVALDMDYVNYTMGKVHNGDTIGTVYSDAFFESFSVEDINHQKTHIYPNPINNNQILQIKVDAKIKSYSIYNIAGKEVQANNFSNNEIKINSLPTGIYILQLNSDVGILRKKLIVK